jgi:hypothetical protein
MEGTQPHFHATEYTYVLDLVYHRVPAQRNKSFFREMDGPAARVLEGFGRFRRIKSFADQGGWMGLRSTQEDENRCGGILGSLNEFSSLASDLPNGKFRDGINVAFGSSRPTAVTVQTNSSSRPERTRLSQ